MARHAKEKKKSKKGILLLLLLILIIIVILLMNRPREPSSGGISLYIDKNAGEYVPSKNDSIENNKNVSIPGWGSITIPANETEVIVDFSNPIDNEGEYYLTFELRIINDSEQGYEVLYTSGLVEPGLHIQKITLSRGMEKGIYDAIIHVQPYRMDENKTPTNNADMKTKLIVE